MLQTIQVEHPQIKGHMVLKTISTRQTTAELRAMRKGMQSKLKEAPFNPRKDYIASVQERGAAKILGLCSSHIYATKLN